MKTSSGILGIGVSGAYSTNVAIPIPNFQYIVDIQAVASSAIALDNYGHVWTWGSNGQGKCGLGYTSTGINAPTRVRNQTNTGYLTNIAVIGVGSGANYATKSSGEVLAWGDNFGGMLGNNQIQNYSSLPVEVNGINGVGTLSNVKKFSYTFAGVVAKMNDCEFVYWGDTSSYNGLGLTQNAGNTPRWLNFSQLPCCEGWGEVQSINASDYTICPNECIDFQANLYYGNATVSWSFPGSSNTLISSGFSVVNVCYSNSGVFNVYAYVDGSSIPSNSIQITVLPQNHRKCQYKENDDDNSMNRMVKDYKDKNQFKVYPNPSKAIFNIDFTDEVEEGSTYTIEDISGKQILEGSIQGNTLQVDLKQYNEGIYFLKLRNNRHRKIIKLVKN